jgi:hypothetical protein
MAQVRVTLHRKGNSAVTVPVDILSMLMAKVMAKAASQSGIVVPGPRVIIPN